MDDVPYLLRDVNPVATTSSVLVSSSRYLNNPELRDWIAMILLRRNGDDFPPQAEVHDIDRILADIRDPQHIEDLFRAERKKDAALDAWFNQRFISSYRRDDLARHAPGTLGGLFHKYLVDGNFEVQIRPWESYAETQFGFFSLRYMQTHDLEHILIGASFDYLAEIVPHWVRIISHFKMFSPELAGELSVRHLLNSLRYVVRTMLHYPECWPAALDALQRAITVGTESEPFYLRRLEDYFDLPLAEARAQLGIRGVVDRDTSRISAVWAERAPLASLADAGK